MKQTAMMEHIQWLKEVINICHSQNEPPTVIIDALEYAIEGAKAKLLIEKEQIKEAWHNGGINGMGLFETNTGEQYYNETYESNTEI